MSLEHIVTASMVIILDIVLNSFHIGNATEIINENKYSLVEKNGLMIL